MHLADFADHAALDHLHRPAVGGAGMHLNPHLRGQSFFLGGEPKLPGFKDFVRQRLLAIHGLVVIEGRHRRRGVGVVRRGDDDGINGIAHLVEQFTEVGKGFGAGVFFVGLFQTVGIHIAKGGHFDLLVGGDGTQIPRAHAAHADMGRPQFAVGRCGKRELRPDAARRQDHAAFQKLATLETHADHLSSNPLGAIPVTSISTNVTHPRPAEKQAGEK